MIKKCPICDSDFLQNSPHLCLTCGWEIIYFNEALSPEISGSIAKKMQIAKQFQEHLRKTIQQQETLTQEIAALKQKNVELHNGIAYWKEIAGKEDSFAQKRSGDKLSLSTAQATISFKVEGDRKLILAILPTKFPFPETIWLKVKRLAMPKTLAESDMIIPISKEKCISFGEKYIFRFAQDTEGFDLKGRFYIDLAVFDKEKSYLIVSENKNSYIEFED